MEKIILETKLEELDESFEKIQKEIRGIENKEAQLAQQKQERNVELFRLQGEHRLLKDLLKGGKKEGPAAPAPEGMEEVK